MGVLNQPRLWHEQLFTLENITGFSTAARVFCHFSWFCREICLRYFFFNSSHCTAFICLSTQVIFFIVDIVCRCVLPFNPNNAHSVSILAHLSVWIFLFTVLTVQQPVSNSWSALKQREMSISRTAAPDAVSSTLVILLFYNSCKRWAGLQGSSGDR